MTDDDNGPIESAEASQLNQKSLELLFDYTKFHLGIYLTLTASYVTVTSIRVKDAFALKIHPDLVWPAIICFMMAGLAGGIIASSITQTPARSSKDFLDSQIGPWEIKRLKFRARIWTWIEHTAFWIGLALAALSVQRPT